MRKTVLADGEIYHIFNRTIEQKPVFAKYIEANRALTTLDFYRFKNPTLRLAKFLQIDQKEKEIFLAKRSSKSNKLIDIISFCLMPNHFHFLLRQTSTNGIAKFLSLFTNSYTRYFNTKEKRTGPLFQGSFQAVRIETDEQLIHVSRYIHINPTVSFVVKEGDLEAYPWSSLPEFLDSRPNLICDKETVLTHFKNVSTYQQFLHDQIDYARELEKIKHLTLEY